MPKRAPRNKARSGRITIGELVEFYIGEPNWRRPDTEFLSWPPDTFAVALSLLKESGAYIRITTQDFLAPNDGIQDRDRKLSLEWKEKIEAGDDSAPEGVAELWSGIYFVRNRSLSSLMSPTATRPVPDADKAWFLLVRLCSIADETWRLLPTRSEPKSKQELSTYLFAEKLRSFSEDGVIGNLCTHRISSLLTVLPKMRTPQNGLSIRCVSRYLALLPNTEVGVRWQDFNLDNSVGDNVNLLVLPWPTEIYPVQFQDALRDGATRIPDYRYFKFNVESNPEEAWHRLHQLLMRATQHYGKIHGIVLLEMAIDQETYACIHTRLSESGPNFPDFLIAGIYVPPQGNDFEGMRPGKNFAKIVKYPRLKEDGPELSQLIYERTQEKHHRWMLNASQIQTYGLGAQLNPKFAWWEYTEVSKRELHVSQIAPGLAMTVLICEDLARPDPVGDAVRAIGPNLLIALLQDGPQLATRWGSRYATVLADDPGCSVLTITGLGLCELSRPPNRKPSRVVALWQQPEGEAREIELPAGYEALVLNLTVKSRNQWTIDGRSHSSGQVSLSGVHPIREL